MGFTRSYDVLKMYAMGAPFWDGIISVANKWYFQTNNPNHTAEYSITGYQSIRVLSDTSSGGSAPIESPMYKAGGLGSNQSLESGYDNRSGGTLVDCGTSDVAESYEDWTMATFNKEILNDYDVEFDIASDNKSITVTMWQSYKNTSGTSQTVKEVGLWKQIKGCYNTLIYRKVLETPFVVPNDEYFRVKVTYVVPVPTNLIPTVTPPSITVKRAGDTVGVFKTANDYGFSVLKLRNGLAVAGYYTYGNNLVGCMLVSQTNEGTWQSGCDNTSTSFTYNGNTYYYQNHTDVLNGATPASPAKSSGAAHYLGNYATLPSDISEIATDLLDYYYDNE